MGNYGGCLCFLWPFYGGRGGSARLVGEGGALTRGGASGIVYELIGFCFAGNVRVVGHALCTYKVLHHKERGLLYVIIMTGANEMDCAVKIRDRGAHVQR